MVELNDKLITYGNLSTFYDKLQEQGLGGNAIEEISELPEASENKDKFFRLDNSDKDVYAAKLISSTVLPPTNRLPDKQQIDKAYIYYDDAEAAIHYKGLYNIVCTDGETTAYLWASEFNYIFSLDNAEHITENGVVAMDSVDDWNVESGNTLSTEWYTLSDFNDEFSMSIIDSGFLNLIPAIYNAPESAQIGNADCGGAIYTGDEVTLVVSDGERTGWKWSYNNGNFEVTNKPASEMYCKVNAEEGEHYCDTKFIYVNVEGQGWTASGNTYTNLNYTLDDIQWISNTEDEINNIYIPQLNAPDSEQVDNAYIDLGDGEGVYKYKGDTLCTIIVYTDVENENTYTGYKWETDDNEFICFTSLKASEIYGQTTTTIYTNGDGNDDWAGLADNVYEASILGVNTLDEMVDDYSTVKYQRTEVTEVWDWEKVATEQYVDDAIDNIEFPKYVAGDNIEITSGGTINVTGIVDDTEVGYNTTFSSSKILDLVDAIAQFNIEVVDALPESGMTTNTIYLVPSSNWNFGDNLDASFSEKNNERDEYLWIVDESTGEGHWELIGSTQISLADYYTVDEVNHLLDEKQDEVNATIAEVLAALNGLDERVTALENR